MSGGTGVAWGILWPPHISYVRKRSQNVPPEFSFLKPSESYRPDIDGLRAVSVILVVLFHAGLGVTGGFVGVDVFFVISGYLITSLILKQQAAGKFDLAEFFARRVRRIIPAVSVMTLATLVLGSFCLSPAAWMNLAQSAVAQTAMVANVWYWRTINYFTTEAELKPLLHMWSLAVEEQFYLVYPFLLVFMGRSSRRTLFFVLSSLAVVSFVLAESILPIRASAVYYLLPFRAWELLLGGIVSLLPRHRFTRWSEVEVTVGSALVLGPAFLYNAKTPFPGLHALPPCVGAAMIIHGGSWGTTLVGRLLGSRPMVAVGLLSYSIYLWHWPLLALARNLLGIRLPWPVAAGLVGFSVALAAASWRCVEEPIRRGASFDSRWFSAKLFMATSASVLGLAGGILAGHGVPGRFTPRTLGFFAGRTDTPFRRSVTIDAAERGDLPAFGDAKGRMSVIVWGDSHAMMIVPGVDAACRKFGIGGVQATYWHTPALLDFVCVSSMGHSEKAPRFNRAVLKEILDRHPSVVIVGGVWREYAEHPDFEQALSQTVDAVTSAGIPLCFVLDPAVFPVPVAEALARRSFFGQGTTDLVVTPEDYQAKNRQANEIIRRVAAERAIVLDPAEVLTDANGNWVAQIDGEALYHDSSHLSGAGGRLLAPLFERLFQELGLGDPSLP
jgi:peptidoglycan/LPS O-acetylase OafA/YrhL